MQRGALRTGVALALVAIAGLLALTACGLLIWALYGWLALSWAQPQAAALTGAAILAVTGVVAWVALRLGR
ncbi:MAG TPA: hypothetical protein ENK05_08965 [Gammaproteobacteria bacterium]|nr:hypothetical protein [Gammaproteobacteria bacterium]